MPPKPPPVDLASHWQRHDWRESFLAPGLAILQALTRSGRTASGADASRDLALRRCLSETAEIAALDQPGQRAAFDPRRDGIAAHPDPAVARHSADCEAFERRMATLWWRGEIKARALSPAWQARSGLQAALAQARAGAAVRRRTGWWQIGAGRAGPCVVVCVTSSQEGQDPIPGYGCDADPAVAAAKALREALLMELNLMEVMALRAMADPQARAAAAPLAARLADLARHLPLILPDLAPQTGSAPVASQLLSGPADWFGLRLQRRDIAPPGAPLPVWLCRPETDPPAAPAGGPFL